MTRHLWSESDLEVLATRQAVNRFADEKVLHDENAPLRLSGEWFSADAAFGEKGGQA